MAQSDLTLVKGINAKTAKTRRKGRKGNSKWGCALFHLPLEVVQFLCVVFLGGYGVALEAIEA